MSHTTRITLVLMIASLGAPCGLRAQAVALTNVTILWDMHAHLAARTPVGRSPERYVGHGVLYVRDMG